MVFRYTDIRMDGSSQYRFFFFFTRERRTFTERCDKSLTTPLVLIQVLTPRWKKITSGQCFHNLATLGTKIETVKALLKPQKLKGSRRGDNIV